MSLIPPPALRTRLALKLSAMACATTFALAPALAKPKDTPPGQAQPAAVECGDSPAITANVHYAGVCQGPLQGNITQGSSVTLDGESFDLFGDSKGSDGLVQAPHGEAGGTLGLAQDLYGRFVLALKSGNSYSLYLFDSADEGLHEIAFDTSGVSVGQGDKLSHAFVFAPPGTPQQGTGGTEGGAPQDVTAPQAVVPEPATGALALAALAAAGLAARRRRR